MGTLHGGSKLFFPRADAALLSKHQAPLTRPHAIGPVYDPDGGNRPIEPWSLKAEECLYPPNTETYTPAPIPSRSADCASDRYVRASLAENERLRLSMLWYYTRDILSEHEFLSGLQQKVQLAQESTEWEFAIVGILDLSVYIRLATIGTPLGILPRGETLCAHTVTRPPGCVFLLPNMLEDWRFQTSPYVESGGLHAYAGAPLRLQNETGDSVALGSLCVASTTSQKPLTKTQQQTLIHLADWVVSDIVQCARARRQRERRRMTDLLFIVQSEVDSFTSEGPILDILKTIYPDATMSLKSSEVAQLDAEGRDPILLSDFENGLWEDTEHIDHFIANLNHNDIPNNRVVRAISVQCESMLGPSLLAVASKDFRLIFDDIDLWFVQACATMLSQMWHKCLLSEAMKAKEKFLRGVSHQLRTPIHGILGSVELLAEELNAREKFLGATSTVQSNGSSVYLDTIKMSGQDLISIVNSMITLNSWADIAMKDRCYTSHPIHELEADLANESSKAISQDPQHQASVFFRYILPTGCTCLRTDYSLLRNSLLPIITNAMQNTPKGTVMVTTSMSSSTGELIVDVEDDGRGICLEDHPRIFEPFEKVGVHSTGAGLGLTLASRFAALLRGSAVLVSSDVDHGSHFRATFRDVGLVDSAPSLQPPAPELENLPSTFYSITADSQSISPTRRFITILSGLGFTPSDSIDNCFIILDFVPDLELHRSHLSQIPPGQVAICLVPASDRETWMDRSTENTVYINGPFLSSTLASALIKADVLVSVIKASPALQHESAEISPPCLTVNEGSSTDEGAQLLANLTLLTAQPAQLPPDNLAGPDLEVVTLSTPQVDEDYVTEAKEAVSISISPILAIHSRPRALLVDDNNINLRIMQMYCTKRGIPYCCATNGRQAIEQFSQQQSLAFNGNGSPIQLVLMDLQMPVCDGLEATRQIRRLEQDNQWEKSIIFMVTGQDNPADRTAADGAGAEEYFVKPVGMKTLDYSLERYFPGFKGT